MTIEEATALAAMIQRAFPNSKIPPAIYARTLLKYELEASQKAIERAIQREWRFPPSGYELWQVLVAVPKPEPETCPLCDGDWLVDAGHGEYAPCPRCHPLKQQKQRPEQQFSDETEALGEGIVETL